MEQETGGVCSASPTGNKPDQRAISGLSRAVIRGHSGILAGCHLPRSGPLPLVTGPICKQGVRSPGFPHP